MVGRGEQHEQQFLAAPSDDRMVAGGRRGMSAMQTMAMSPASMAAHVVDELGVVDIALGRSTMFASPLVRSISCSR